MASPSLKTRSRLASGTSEGSQGWRSPAIPATAMISGVFLSIRVNSVSTVIARSKLPDLVSTSARCRRAARANSGGSSNLRASRVAQAFDRGVVAAQPVFAEAAHGPGGSAIRLELRQLSEGRGALGVAVEIVSDRAQVPQAFVPVRFELERPLVQRDRLLQLLVVARLLRPDDVRVWKEAGAVLAESTDIAEMSRAVRGPRIWVYLTACKAVRLKRKGRAPLSETPARYFRDFPSARSEVELDRDLDHAMALLLGDHAEQRRIHLAGVAIEAETEIASVERPQRVVQEVVPVKPELQLLRLP